MTILDEWVSRKEALNILKCKKDTTLYEYTKKGIIRTKFKNSTSKHKLFNLLDTKKAAILYYENAKKQEPKAERVKVMGPVDLPKEIKRNVRFKAGQSDAEKVIIHTKGYLEEKNLLKYMDPLAIQRYANLVDMLHKSIEAYQNGDSEVFGEMMQLFTQVSRAEKDLALTPVAFLKIKDKIEQQKKVIDPMEDLLK